MTQPNVDAQQSAFESIAHLALPTLSTQPRLVAGLASAGATPQQAGAVDALAGAAQAAQQVQAARASGAKITLTQAQKDAMDAAGLTYGDVEATPDHWGVGRVVHDAFHNPVMDSIDKAYNFINSGATVAADAVVHTNDNSAYRAQFKQQMIAAGYDPNSKLSEFAFVASGRARTDIDDLTKDVDPSVVDLALQYANDPDNFEKTYLGDPTLTPDQVAQRTAQLQNPALKPLANKIAGRQATIGTWAVSSVQWQAIPVAGSIIQHFAGDRGMEDSDSTGRKLLAGTIDAAYGGALDPTLAVGGVTKAYRMRGITVGMTDYNKMHAVIAGDGVGAGAAQVHNGIKSMIADTTAIREGTDAEKAAAYAHIKAATPQLIDLVDDFNGTNQAIGWEHVTDDAGNVVEANGVPVLALKFGKGTPLTTPEQAADYFASKTGVMRLFAGNAPAEIGYMPGQLSTIGAKRLIGAMAAGRAVRSLKRTDKIAAKGATKADITMAANAAKGVREEAARQADPAKARIDLRNPNTALSMGPLPGDQANPITGEIIDDSGLEHAPDDVLPSQRRGLLSANRGEAILASRTGLRPSAFINRWRQTAQKFGSRLPTNYTMTTSDPNVTQQIMRFVRINGTPGDAYLAAAKYSAADEGTRKAMLVALKLQGMHAAGFGATEIGRQALTEARSGITGQRYGVTDTSYTDNLTGERRNTALFGGQVNETLTLPQFKELVEKGAKIGVWQNTVGRGLNSAVVSNTMHVIRSTWITSYASALRNAFDELGGVFGRDGLGGLVGVFAHKYAADDKGILHDPIYRKLAQKTKAGNRVYGYIHSLTGLYRHTLINMADPREGLKYALDLPSDVLHKLTDDQMTYHMKSMIDPLGADEAAGIVNAGMVPTKVPYRDIEGLEPGKAVEFKRNGYGVYSAGRDAENYQQLWAGSNRYAAHLATITNKSVPQTLTIFDHLSPRKLDEIERLDLAVQGEDAVAAVPARKFIGDKYGSIDLHPDEVGSLDQYVNYGNEFNTPLRKAKPNDETFTHGMSLAARVGDGADRPFGVKGAIKHIDRVLRRSKTTADMKVYRYVNDGRDMFGDDFTKLTDLTGETFGDKGYTSATANPEFLANMERDRGIHQKPLNERRFEHDAPVSLSILVPEGTRAAIVGKKGAHEALLPRNARFKVLADHGTGEDGIRRLDVALVNPRAKPVLAKQSTVDDVLASLKKDPNWGRISRRSDTVRGTDGKDNPIVDAADRDLADHQIAQAQIDEWRALLTKENGELSQPTIDYIRRYGKAPGPDWIQKHLPPADRPAATIAVNWEAVPAKPGKEGLMQHLIDLTGLGYKYAAEIPLSRMAATPIFMANYGRSRVFMEGWVKDLVDGGIAPAEAELLAQNFGMQMAATRTLKYMDNAVYRTQMDVVGRAFFAFQRATEAFVRRWGTELIEDPMRLRRLMLANEAATQMGLVYTDQNGEKNFVYPGSGFMLTALNDVGSFFHVPGLNKVPGLMPDLHSRVSFLNSGLQAPWQMALTPLMMIPAHEAIKFFPSAQNAFDVVDNFFNGQHKPAAGEDEVHQLLGQIEPSTVKRFSEYLSNDDKQGMIANGVKGASANLAADGTFFKNADGSPLDAAQMQAKVAALHAQVKNQILTTAVFGYIAPAAPGEPDEETSGSKADWFMGGAAGVRGLDDEYKKMVSDLGYARANQVWAQIHPDKLVYTVPATESTTKSATLQATANAQKWINANVDYMKNYGSVSAYFVPKGAQEGDFDLGAFHTELEVGLRQEKTTAQFANDVVTAGAKEQYFNALDGKNALMAQNANNPRAQADIEAQWSDFQKSFYGLNPIFAATQTDHDTQVQTANDQLRELTRMVNDPTVPADVPVAQVAQMIRVYREYHMVISAHPGGTNQAQAARADASAQYAAFMQKLAASNPQLAGVYAGVFRTLDDTVLNPLGVQA